MKKRIITTTTYRELSKYEILCEKCNHVEQMIPYCIAQLTMGNPVIFTCKCGNKIELTPF